MMFIHELSFDITYESYQNWLKIDFVNTMGIFDDHHVTSKLTSLRFFCEPPIVKLLHFLMHDVSMVI